MNLIKSEFKKIIQETMAYYPDFIVGSITHFMLFFLLIHGKQENTFTLVSYLFWMIVSGVLSEASINISMEKQLGTLQNLLIKPYSILNIILAKTVVWFFINLLKIILFLIFFSFFYPITPLFRIEILMILVFTCVGIMGLSLILAALTLAFTKIASFEVVISYLLLIVSGSIIEIPKYITYTNPLSFGSHSVFLLLSNHYEQKDFFLLILISMLYLCIGIIVFNTIFRRSKHFRWTY